jgi:spermidine synthase
MDVRIGDARLVLAEEAPASLDVLAVDAFSSDAIPLHLMTREAFDVYDRVLARDGMLVVHITNRHLDLAPVVAAIAGSKGWTARLRNFVPSESDVLLQRSVWIALTRDPSRMQELETATGVEWQPVERRSGLMPWTDDHSSVLPVLKR